MDLPGIFEFKQNNKYVVAEGSVHPTGAVYTRICDAEIIEIPDRLVADLVRLRSTERGHMAVEGRHPAIMQWCAKNWKGPGFEDELIENAIQFDLENHAEPRGAAHAAECARWFIDNDKEVVSGGPAVVLGKARLDEPRTSGTAFDFVLGPRDGEKHGVFALGSLHLVQGSSGNGKTTLMLQMLKAQRDRQPFFGREGTGREYLVVWQDRSKEELERQLDAMDMLNDPPPYQVVDGSKPPAQVIEEIIKSRQVKPEVILVEGLDLWSQDAKDMKHVSTLATAVRSVGEHYHVSLIGTVGMPKMKPKEQYSAPRDRAFGSSAWARKADTVVDITVDPETENRHVQLLLRTGKAQKMQFEFRNGRLHEVEERMPKIIVGVERELTIRELRKALRIGTDAARELLRQVGQNGARELLKQAEAGQKPELTN
jgi:hypothetical protein